MNKRNFQKQVKLELYNFLTRVGLTFSNAVFLCVLLLTQFVVAYLSSLFEIDWISYYLILGIRIFIAILTLTPFVKHTFIQVIEAYEEVRDVWRGLNDSNKTTKNLA